ncbi:glycosyltransferase [Frondihabitans cladoniiphilus]|uniref:Glycosyl transferase family 2 n=1 Tax=Frondihabitans cladoniiphilus TaxID=715785 RepID=A0ABP8VX50_9MICO
MRTRSALGLAALGVSVAAGHVVYPMALAALTKFKSAQPVRPAPAVWPPVTVIVPAYLERNVIADKVRDVKANGYPGEVTVLVVADGDEATASIAAAAGAEVLLLTERGGKSQALNAGVAVAETEWIVLTDANAVLTPGSLQRLVAWLDDETVGAVAGEKLEGDGGELAYWKFTSWIKRAEWKLGSTLAMDGGLCAVRKSAWDPIPKDISCDDFWISLDMNDRGYRVAYEPEARVIEDTIGSFGQSWERRTRVLGSSLFVLWKKRHMLSPTRPVVSSKIWGHKLWRSTAGPLSHVALLGIATGTVRTSRLSQVFLVGNAAAALFVVAQSREVDLPKPASLVAQVAYLQAVALGGMVRFVQGDRALKWKKPER